MKLMVLTHRLPYPPHDGHRRRVYHLTRELSRLNRLSLATFIGAAEELDYLPKLKDIFDKVYTIERRVVRGVRARMKNIFEPRPYSVSQHRMGAMDETVRECAAEKSMDAALVFNMEMAQYCSSLRELPKVLDAVDCVSEVSRQKISHTSHPVEKLKAFVDWQKMGRYEARAYLNFNLVMFTTSLDRDAALRNCSRLKTEVLPNGVDSEYFSPRGNDEGHPDLIFTGAMNYYPNFEAALYFCRRILPLILKKRPEVRFLVVGNDPGDRVRERLKRFRNTVVTGFVEDVRTYLDSAAIFVCPMRMGMGVKNKLLEAMAMAKPVVCTPQSLSGIKAEPGGEVVVAESPGSFADEVVRLLESREERRSLGRAARDSVIENHGWQRIGQKLHGRIQAIVEACK